MNYSEIEKIEIELLLEAIYKRYGYDFREYAKATLERRTRIYVKRLGLNNISEIIPKLLRDEDSFEKLIKEYSITVTELFRDPSSYKEIISKVIPVLKTYPFIKIWHAGCATGEEVYSLAILLKEEGMYDKATIYATDFNDEALAAAKEGIYSIENMKQFTANYAASGGKDSLSKYYIAHNNSVKFDKSLIKNVTFANHNLVTDRIFGEMHLIMCKNVLIYFNKELQEKVLNLFNESLIHGGFLCLGDKESIQFTNLQDKYEIISKKAKIYKKNIFAVNE